MKRRLMILLLGAMMLLAACGTSDTTETDGTSGTETSEATSPPLAPRTPMWQRRSQSRRCPRW